MEELLKSLTSPSWWIGVVVVGILINVLSAYLKTPLDKLFSSLSTGWRERSESRIKKRNDLISKLKSDDNLLVLYALTENRYRIRSASFYLMAFFFFTGSILVAERSAGFSIAGLIFSMLLIFSGLHDHAEAMKVKSIVEDSNDKYKDICA